MLYMLTSRSLPRVASLLLLLKKNGENWKVFVLCYRNEERRVIGGRWKEMYKIVQLRDQTETISINKWTVNIARLLLNHQQLMNPIPVSLHFTELTWTLSHDILLIPLNFGKQSLLTIVSLVCGTRGAPHYHLICKAIFHWAIIFCYTCMCVSNSFMAVM